MKKISVADFSAMYCKHSVPVYQQTVLHHIAQRQAATPGRRVVVYGRQSGRTYYMKLAEGLMIDERMKRDG